MANPKSTNQSTNQSHSVVKQLGPPESVPVFNCMAYLSPVGESGKLNCRCANLAGLQLVAASEREALQQIVALFKEKVARCQTTGADIPWIDPPEKPAENESVRYLAVHL